MAGIFDTHYFNEEVFTKYMDALPSTKLNALIKSGAVLMRSDLAAAMTEQGGGNFHTGTISGRISAANSQNYDGTTDIESESVTDYTHSRVVCGRSGSWTEKDFAVDISGRDGMEVVASQISEYWDEVRQLNLIATLTGIFSMTGAENKAFVDAHTYDTTSVKNSAGNIGCMDATTMNTAMQRACGDQKSKFVLAAMHSAVATNLENLNILVYAKFNDKDGMQRDVSLGTVNGRLVLIDDSMPTFETAVAGILTADEEVTAGKQYYTRSGSEGSYVFTAVDEPANEDISTYYEATELQTRYVTFVLGIGCIELTACPVQHPYEMARDAKTKGGMTSLISRQRNSISPYGISFTRKHMKTRSPSITELADGANWELDKAADGTVIPHKLIPIARIISLG